MPYTYIGFDGIQDVKVLSDLNLDNCSSLGQKFRLALVDNSSEFRIVSNLRVTPSPCPSPQIAICKSCTADQPCVANMQCIVSSLCTGHEPDPAYCFCPPPKPTPPPSPPAPTPKPCSDSSRIDKNTCEHDNLTTYSYVEHLFSAASASGGPVPNQLQVLVLVLVLPSQCKWDGSLVVH